MRYNLVSYSILEQGERENQEDSLYSWETASPSVAGLYMIADGMGGFDNGEIASSTLLRSLSESIGHIGPDVNLGAKGFMGCMSMAYRDLDNADRFHSKMGTTLALVKFNDSGCLVANVGDSRVYHIRCESGRGKVLFKTRDHTVVSSLLEKGEIAEKDVQSHSQRHVLSRAIQASVEQRSPVDTYELNDIRIGDYFFICSDGMQENLTDEILLDIVSSESGDREKRNLLLSLAKNSQDNYSSILIHVVGSADNSISDMHGWVRKSTFWLGLILGTLITAVLAALFYYFNVLER